MARHEWFHHVRQPEFKREHGNRVDIGSPTYVGGSSPTTWSGYALASTSLGHLKASNGTDIGITVGSVPSPPAVVSPPTNLDSHRQVGSDWSQGPWQGRSNSSVSIELDWWHNSGRSMTAGHFRASEATTNPVLVSLFSGLATPPKRRDIAARPLKVAESNKLISLDEGMLHYQRLGNRGRRESPTGDG